MTTDIKELAKRLRAKVYLGAAGVHFVNQDGPAAADALEAMAGKVERLKETITTAVQFNEGLAAERDRLQLANARMKAALVEVEDRLNCRGNPDIAHYCPNCDNSLHNAREIARKALGGDA